MATNQEMLTAVQTAILTIVTSGQSYAILGRSMTRANLTELRDLEQHYQSLVTREQSGRTGARVRYVEPN